MDTTLISISACPATTARGFPAHLFLLLGDDTVADELEREADAIATAINEAFFDPGSGLYLDRRKHDVADTEPSVIGNTLAVLFEIAPGDAAPHIAGWISEQLQDNFYRGDPTANRAFRCSPYFSFYAIEVLYRFGYDAEVLRYIRKHWSYMIENGAWTCWEFFARQCSLCHAWASCPTHYLSTHLLGIHPAADGDPNHYVFDPRPGMLGWAEGAYPHGDESIQVRWDRSPDGRMTYALSVPDGVRVDIADKANLVPVSRGI